MVGSAGTPRYREHLGDEELAGECEVERSETSQEPLPNRNQQGARGSERGGKDPERPAEGLRSRFSPKSGEVASERRSAFRAQ